MTFPGWRVIPNYGQPASSKLVAVGLAPGTQEKMAATQLSQPSGDSVVTSSQPLGSRSIITESHFIGAQNGQAQMPAWWNGPLQSQEQQPNPGLLLYQAVLQRCPDCRGRYHFFIQQQRSGDRFFSIVR